MTLISKSKPESQLTPIAVQFGEGAFGKTSRLTNQPRPRAQCGAAGPGAGSAGLHVLVEFDRTFDEDAAVEHARQDRSVPTALATIGAQPELPPALLVAAAA